LNSGKENDFSFTVKSDLPIFHIPIINDTIL